MSAIIKYLSLATLLLFILGIIYFVVTRKKKRRTNIEIRITFFIIVIVILALFVNVLLEEVITKQLNLRLKNTLDISMTIFTVVTTIFSILIPLYNDEIYGVTYLDFNKIRKDNIDFVYSTIFMFVLYMSSLWFYELKCIIPYIAILIIMSIGFIYVIYKEGMIITKRQKHIDKIIVNNINKIGNDLVVMEEEILNRIIKKQILSRSIQKMTSDFESLGVDVKKLENKINNLLINTLKEYSSLSKNELIDTLKNEYNLNSKGYIDILYTNITYIIKKDSESLAKDIYELILLYHKIINLLLPKEDNTYSLVFNLLNNSLVIDDKDKSNRGYIYSVINGILVWTITKNEIWFLNILHENVFNDLAYINTYRELFVHISIYLHWFVEEQKHVRDELKENIINILKGKSFTQITGTHIRSWTDLYNHVYDRNYIRFEELYKVYTNNYIINYWEQPIINKTLIYKVEDLFNFQKYVEWWIHYTLTSYSNNIKDNAINTLDAISPELQDQINSTLNNKNIIKIEEKGAPFNENNLKVNQFYGLERNVFETPKNFEIKKILMKIKRNIFEQSNDSINKRENKMEMFLDEVRKLFEGKVDELFGMDENVNNNLEEKYFSFQIETRDTYDWKEFYIEQIYTSLQLLIQDDYKKSIEKGEIKALEVSGLNELKKKIDELNPDYVTEPLDYYFASIDVNNLSKYQKIKSFPNNFFSYPFTAMKEGGVKFNIMLDVEKTKKYTRKLTNEEVDQKIEREYTKIKDDVYIYKTDSGWIPLNKTSLRTKIKEKYIVAIIFFNIEIKWDSSKIIYMDANKFYSLS